MPRPESRLARMTGEKFSPIRDGLTDFLHSGLNVRSEIETIVRMEQVAVAAPTARSVLPIRLPDFSLRAKFMMLACAFALLTAALVGGASYAWIIKLSLERAIEKQHTEARLIASRVQAAYDGMEHDAVAISHMPPFQGLIRSLRNGGLDPHDGSTDSMWRRRLETIFTSVMQRRPEYAQMRFIGVANGGLELVRCNRRGEVIEPVPEAILQSKADQPYFREALSLAADGVRFSAVTDNVDNGVVEHGQPMLRVMAAVRDPDGLLFGVMVINAHYDALLTGALSDAHARNDVYVVNDTGDFIHRSPNGRLSDLVRGDADMATLPELTKAVLQNATGNSTQLTLADRQELILTRADVGFDAMNADRMARVVVVAPHERVLAGAYQTRDMALLLSALLLIASAALVFTVTGQLLKPVRDISSRLRAFVPERTVLDLPVNRRDEIGDFARAFGDTLSRLESARHDQQMMLARMQAILDNTADAVVTFDEDGAITSFNKSAEAMFGFSASEALGRNVGMLMPVMAGNNHSGRVRNYLETAERPIIERVREEVARAKDGRQFPIELSIGAVNVDGQRLFSGIIRDISKRQEMERQLRRQSAALERSNRDLEDFAYIASHDLKEPLRAIHNHVQFLEEDHGEVLGEAGARRLDRMKLLCLRSDKLISDLLQFSRLSRAELEYDLVDLEEVVREVCDNLAEALEQSSACVEIVTPMPKLRGDRPRLVSLLHNLIVNGIKYNDSREKRIEVGFQRGVSDGEAVRDAYFVRDNGIGIEPKFKDSVFKIFKRLNSEKAYGVGTGAGLSFAKKIVERHGGVLWLESEPGCGTTFYFSLYEQSA